MLGYQKILVALDINSPGNLVMSKALAVADSPSKLNLLYVTFAQTYFEPYGIAFENDELINLQEQSEHRLEEIAVTSGVPKENTHVVVGSPADEIHRYAERIEADLIVIGTHGQSGLKLLLGSTANGVLHGVKCDVLAVKV